MHLNTNYSKFFRYPYVINIHTNRKAVFVSKAILSTISKHLFFVLLCSTILSIAAQAQVVSRQIDIPYKDKPKEYQSKTLRAEKTADEKQSAWKRFTQGTYSHFNYIFNAQLRLQTILTTEISQSFQNADFTHLLRFYPEETPSLSQNTFLDTIIHKATGALLLHDLRNNWVDEEYLLFGKAYYYKKNLDTAEFNFRFLDYAYAPKDEDGYDIPIASNLTNDKQEVEIFNKEPSKWKHYPRRNEGLLWLCRTLISANKLDSAQGLLRLFQEEPHFPKKETSLLHETLAYLYYQQEKYDSAAFYLSQTTPKGSNLKTWRYFLTAQLFQKIDSVDQAQTFYQKAANSTANSRWSSYAILNKYLAALETAAATQDQKDQAVQALESLSQKRKYRQYQQIFAYNLAKYYQENDQIQKAEDLFEKTLKLPKENNLINNQIYYLMAKKDAEREQFKHMAQDYDSIQAPYSTDTALNKILTINKASAGKIEKLLDLSRDQDSLIYLANMPKKDQDKVLKKQLRSIRHQLGLSDEMPALKTESNTNLQPDIFNSTKLKGDWYFNNSKLIADGKANFIQKYGERPNEDNWFLESKVTKRLTSGAQSVTNTANQNKQTIDSAALTLEDLRNLLPLKEDQQENTKNGIAKNLLEIADIFRKEMGDYPSANYFYNAVLKEHKNSPSAKEAAFGLALSTKLSGNLSSADSMQQILKREYPSDKNWSLFEKPVTKPSISSEVNEGTKVYADIYNKIIEGQFKEAEAQKKVADAKYHNYYWTPQLLYVEAIYNVSERQDSAAIQGLEALKNQFKASPMAEKAVTMIDVIRRRKEIEDYLTKLQIKKMEDDPAEFVLLDNKKTLTKTPEREHFDIIDDSTANKKKFNELSSKNLNIKPLNPLEKIEAPTIESFSFDPDSVQYVVVLLDKVAPVFANEAANAFNRYNMQYQSGLKLAAKSYKLDDRYYISLVGPFTNAIGALLYIDQIKPIVKQRILPWLTDNKYSFFLISKSNYDLLQKNKDIEGYKAILHQALPNKF